MTKRFSLSLIALLAALLGISEANAQQIDVNSGQVVWKGTTLADALSQSQEGKFIYLIQFKSTLSENDPERYISSGGAYGVQGVLSSVGMRMQFVRNGSNYQVVTRIENPGTASHNGDRMGYDSNGTGSNIYLDRGTTQADNNYVNWTITETTATKTNIRYQDEAASHTETVNVVTFRNANGGQYYAGISNGRLVSSNTATQWIIVSEDDFNEAMAKVTWGEVDLGVFIQDAEFGRDNKDAVYWEWGTWDGTTWNKDDNQDDAWTLGEGNLHWHQRNQNTMCNGTLISNGISRAKAGANVAGTGSTLDEDGFRNVCGQYYKAEIYNEAIALSQTLSDSNIPNLTEGLYKLSAQALYFDGANGSTNNNVAYFVVRRIEYTDNSRSEVKDVSIQKLPVAPLNSLTGNNITTVSGVSAGYVMNTNEDAYKLNFFLEISGTTDITIGIEQAEATGWTVIGNVHLYAHGKQAIFIDEDWCEQTRIPYVESGQTIWSTKNPYEQTLFMDKYEYPTTVYYNRTFTKDKFNPICLPLDLTGNQVRQTFGNDCMLSEFAGLEGSCLKFRQVNLDTDGIKSGVPYIVKVTTDPVVKAGEQITMEVGNGHENHTVTLDGPIYYIAGVTKEAYSTLPELKPVTVGDFTFEGTFYRKSILKETLDEQDVYMITKGDMYHLDGTKPGNTYDYDFDNHQDIKNPGTGYMIWGTYAYLHADKASGEKVTTLSILGVDEDITALEGVYFEGSSLQTNALNDGSVYTLSGQKAASNGTLEGLAKGIYIVNGKKFVVK
ncbi:MAG: hypothetical protein IJ196_01075 [Prevotella sp.]|nr:hypothetical protein [Prevotella sp.]